MTRAYRLDKTLVTDNLQYPASSFPVPAGHPDADDLLGWLGVDVILASGISATYYNARDTARCDKASLAEANDPIATEA